MEFQQCQCARRNAGTNFAGSNVRIVLRFECFKRQQHISRIVKTWQGFQDFQERVLRLTAENTWLKFLPMLSDGTVAQMNKTSPGMSLPWHTMSLLVNVMSLLCQWSSLNVWHVFWQKNNKSPAHFKERFDWSKIAKTNGVFGGLELKSISDNLKFDVTLVQHI